MNLNDLYDLESEAHLQVSALRDKKQKELNSYLQGVEDGFDIMFKAVREKLKKELETENEQKKQKDCL